jgi:hypothetical protein
MKRKSGLVGKWFHSFKTIKDRDQREIDWQGQVLSRHPGNMYLVQLYEWISGSATDQLLVNFEDMKFWIFYNDDEQMRFQCSKIEAQRRFNNG